MFNFKKFCEDFRIPIAPKGHQHYRRNWVNIECPQCSGSRGWHGGYNQKNGFYTCYRCGWHPIEKIIQALTKSIDNAFIKSLILKYQTEEIEQLENQTIHADKVRLPETKPLSQVHKDYLASRQFDPEKLEKQYNLKATTEAGKYKFRILAPITFHNEVVSFQCRDYTDTQKARYMDCEKEDEVIDHKHILYGWDQIPYNCKNCIVVEGITGVWRLGPGALGTFGANYHISQVRLLASRFEKIYTFFDPDDAGEKAGKMIGELQAIGKEAIQLETIEGYDSGSIPQDIADELMEKIL